MIAPMNHLCCRPNASFVENRDTDQKPKTSFGLSLGSLKFCSEGKQSSPVWTKERRHKGEQDIHLGAMYEDGPQGVPQTNRSLTPGAHHNFKASLCPILP